MALNRFYFDENWWVSGTGEWIFDYYKLYQALSCGNETVNL